MLCLPPAVRVKTGTRIFVFRLRSPGFTLWTRADPLARPHAGQNEWQPGGAGEQRRFGIGAGSAQWTGDEILQEKDGDVVGHQRDQNFVAAESRANQADDAGP